MKLVSRTTQLLVTSFFLVVAVAAQNGKVVEQTPYKVPGGSYQEWLEGLKSRPPGDARDTAFDEQAFRRNNSPELFARLQKGEGVEGFKLKYLSDGLQVVGFLVKPKTVSGKLPVVIYNRGGHREFGRITLGTMLELANFAEAGFVVLASEYRGNAGSEGKDEAGGADVNDVLNPVPLAESLGYADTKNLFVRLLAGRDDDLSRTETWLASARGSGCWRKSSRARKWKPKSTAKPSLTMIVRKIAC